MRFFVLSDGIWRKYYIYCLQPISLIALNPNPAIEIHNVPPYNCFVLLTCSFILVWSWFYLSFLTEDAFFTLFSTNILLIIAFTKNISGFNIFETTAKIDNNKNINNNILSFLSPSFAFHKLIVEIFRSFRLLFKKFQNIYLISESHLILISIPHVAGFSPPLVKHQITG